MGCITSGACRTSDTERTELSNWGKNDVAEVLSAVDNRTLMVDVRESSKGVIWPTLQRLTPAVVVVDDSFTKIDIFGLARELKNLKMLETNAESWAICQAQETSYEEECELQTVLLTMRDRTSVQQVKQLMPFIDFLLEEEEMSGKEIWLCVSNLRLFFKVYNPTAEDAFKAKVVTGAIKEENKPTRAIPWS